MDNQTKTDKEALLNEMKPALANIRSDFHQKKQIDTSVLSIKHDLVSLDNYVLKDGVSAVTVDDVVLELFYKQDDTQSSLVVFFNGSLYGKQPEFKRWSYYSHGIGSVINIADPMYHYYDVPTGWYWGDSDNCYSGCIVKLLKKIEKQASFSSMIFYASSAGGNVAVTVAHDFPGSKVILINPQIRIDYHSNFRYLVEKQLVNYDDPQILDRIDCSRLIDGSMTVLYAVNMASEEDVIQISHLLGSKGIKDIHSGLNVYGKLFVFAYYAPGPKPHSNQDFSEIVPFLFGIVKEKIKMEDTRLINLLNRCWFDHFNSRHDNKLAIRQCRCNNEISLVFPKSEKRYCSKVLVSRPSCGDNYLFKWNNPTDSPISILMIDQGEKIIDVSLTSNNPCCVVSIGDRTGSIKIYPSRGKPVLDTIVVQMEYCIF